MARGVWVSVPEKHMIKIAIQTLRMPDAMVGVMGGMDKSTAREVLKKHGLYKGEIKRIDQMKENPRKRRKKNPARPGEVEEIMSGIKEIGRKTGVAARHRDIGLMRSYDQNKRYWLDRARHLGVHSEADKVYREGYRDGHGVITPRFFNPVKKKSEVVDIREYGAGLVQWKIIKTSPHRFVVTQTDRSKFGEKYKIILGIYRTYAKADKFLSGYIPEAVKGSRSANPGTKWHRKQENIHLKKHKGAMSKLGAKYYEGKIHAHQDSIREGWKRKPRRKK